MCDDLLTRVQSLDEVSLTHHHHQHHQRRHEHHDDKQFDSIVSYCFDDVTLLSLKFIGQYAVAPSELMS